MRIGDLAQATGASIRSLRYYEERGLITAGRSDAGQRLYDASAVARVRLVRRLLDAGLGTAAVADVLPCVADGPSATPALTARLIHERDRITEEIDARTATRAALQQLIDAAPPMTDSGPGDRAAGGDGNGS